jgi:hypothetical protein
MGGKRSWTPTAAVALAPAAAFLFSKLPQWLAGGKLAKFMGDHVWTVALVIGVTAFASVAVAADVIVQAVARPAGGWPIGADGSLTALSTAVWPWLAITSALTLLTGWSNGFVNLSSLHSFYAGRLTRAYLGASNVARLVDAIKIGDKAPITDNHAGDHVDLSRSRAIDSIGPIHLINVTLNETRSRGRSQLMDRDRKGVPVVFAPEGVLINAGRNSDAALIEWSAIRSAGCVDALSVGQACAISGAAASSGMGGRTTLGGALAFTFANIRLGYWWMVGDVVRNKLNIPTAGRLIPGPVSTFYYLFNEMTARYSLADSRIYLSDGGHFENSGAYELLRRGVKVIVVGDFAQDEGYLFGDLENLVRKARIDLGLSVCVAGKESVAKLFGEEARRLFLNEHGDEWREHASDPRTGLALLLEVHRRPEQAKGVSDDNDPVGRIVWLKPKPSVFLPEDVQGYRAQHRKFPQEATGDQFFDEAQWESYRAVGYMLGAVLLSQTEVGADLLRRALGGLTTDVAAPPSNDDAPRTASED